MTLPGYNQPYWVKGDGCTPFPRLAGDLKADAIVVGAGITGLTTALLLTMAGRRVIVLEMNRVGGGTTGHSTGHLDASSDQGLARLIDDFGEDAACAVIAAKRAALDHVERWDGELRLDSSFTRVSAYQYAEDARGAHFLEAEYEAAARLGLQVTLEKSAPLPFASRAAIRYDRQARFNPFAYVCSLARVFADRGGTLCEDTRAERIEEAGGKAVIATNRGVVEADFAILAGHAPLLGMFMVQPRAFPFESYVIAARVSDDVPDALYWDTASPYHYARRAADREPRLMLIGGADHRTGEPRRPEKSFADLERYARERYRVEAVEHRWSHEFWQSADGLPFIGVVPGFEKVFVGAAYSGDGLTFGTAAGTIMAHLVMGETSPAAKVFDPLRLKPLVSARSVAAGVARVAEHLLADRLLGGGASPESVPAGEGRVVTVEGERLAVSRDASGKLTALSAACAHMGCIVEWNSAEKTWDCPCHGSRYEADGKPIMGPAKRALEPRWLEAAARH